MSALAEVLAEVNRIRGERNMPPLNELPKGVPGNPDSCPIANALRNGSRARVYPAPGPSDDDSGWFYFGDEPSRPLPSPLGRFARAFDRGAFPDFEASS
jgi:hypothetical protein